MDLLPEAGRALLEFGAALRRFLPFLITVAAVCVFLVTLRWLLGRRRGLAVPVQMASQLVMLAATAVGIIIAILTLPVSENTRGQLLSLLGLVLTAVIALSSTTFVANAMAGLMLRAVGGFRPGDFVRIGEHFGRVSELGLFHIEIQTADRDLTTLPNLFLVTHPVTVVSASGTIVSTTLSLGYDVSHGQVGPLLLQAAEQAGLTDAFVHVIELGDHAVSYRVAGFLGEVKQLLTTRSRLCTAVLDTLHGAGVEILSPNYMAQRPVAAEARVMPRGGEAAVSAQPAGAVVEEIAFDKAERAGAVEALGEELRQIEERRVALEGELQRGSENRPELERELQRLRGRERLFKSLQERAKPDAAEGK